MKIKLLLLISTFITGCSSTIKVSVNSPPPIPDKATIVFIYNGMGLYEEHKTKVLIDDKVVGAVSTMSPLIVAVSPGPHKLYTETAIVIDRITSGYFEKNKVYYMSIWFEGGVWTGSMWISEIPKISEFEVIKYNFQ